MTNTDIEVARRFHDATKYTLVSKRRGDERILMGTPPDLKRAIGEQSPANEPHPFKVYTSLDPIQLPRDFAPLPMPALEAIAESGDPSGQQAIPGLAALARICLLSNGILKRGSHGTGRVIEYRAAGCTGARYHLELYIVCGDLPDLDAGVYHYAADIHAFKRLRSGDYRAALVEATGEEPSVARAPALIVATSTFWRNAWRYQERAYRHVYWDLGTMLANVLAVASAHELPSKVVMGFDDGLVNRLLGVDGEREAAVSIVPVGTDGAISESVEIEPIDHPTRPVSSSEIDFPLIREMHAASSLSSGEEAAAWRSHRLSRLSDGPSGGIEVPLRPLPDGDIPDMPVDEAIRRRRSTRRYDTSEPISFESVSTMLDRSSRPIAFDLGIQNGRITDPYLIVNSVAGLDQGSYALHPERSALERLASGDFRQDAVRLASGQSYAGDAHVNIYWLTDLEPVQDTYGNRGYRVAQLEGAIRAGKLHLAAHALGLGAVGSTSVDDEVIDFFSPQAAGKSYMFVLVFGKRRRRKR